MGPWGNLEVPGLTWATLFPRLTNMSECLVQNPVFKVPGLECLYPCGGFHEFVVGWATHYLVYSLKGLV